MGNVSKHHSAQALEFSKRVFCIFPRLCQNRKLRQSARQIVILVPRTTREQPAPQRNASASQHISTSAQPTTNNRKPTTTNEQRHRHNNQQQMQSHKKSNNTSHSYNSNNSNNSGNTQHQAPTAITFPSSCVPGRTLSRTDARACIKKSRTGATTAETKNNVTWNQTAWNLRRSVR